MTTISINEVFELKLVIKKANCRSAWLLLEKFQFRLSHKKRADGNMSFYIQTDLSRVEPILSILKGYYVE